MAEFDGKAWDDYQQRVLAHLDACGLLDVHVQAVRGSLAVISNGTPEGKALYPSLSPVGRRFLVMVYVVRATGCARTTTWLEPKNTRTSVSEGVVV